MPELPYALETLAPKMSAETFEYHYGKHLQTYVDNLNRLIAGTPYEEMSLEEIIRKADGGIFNNAAQTWNHTFFFRMLTPDWHPVPGKFRRAPRAGFRSVEEFAVSSPVPPWTFRSGMVWLAADKSGNSRSCPSPMRVR